MGISATKALIEGAGGLFKELGSEKSHNNLSLHHVAFGKSRAVNLIYRSLAFEKC
jgi:hypothetical protein